jgi:hypothetical protein
MSKFVLPPGAELVFTNEFSESVLVEIERINYPIFRDGEESLTLDIRRISKKQASPNILAVSFRDGEAAK